MPWYACRVVYANDMDDGDEIRFGETVRAGAFESGGRRSALWAAREALLPEGSRWYVAEWEAELCTEEEDARAIARAMERGDWFADS